MLDVMPVTLPPPLDPCNEPTVTMSLNDDDEITCPHEVTGTATPNAPGVSIASVIVMIASGPPGSLPDVVMGGPDHEFLFEINEFMCPNIGATYSLTVTATDNEGCARAEPRRFKRVG